LLLRNLRRRTASRTDLVIDHSTLLFGALAVGLLVAISAFGQQGSAVSNPGKRPLSDVRAAETRADSQPAVLPIRGFSSSRWPEQHQREAVARSIPDSSRLRIYMDRISARPHIAGSPGSKAVAEFALRLFKEWGLDAKLESFEPLLPYPGTRVLEMTAPVQFEAKLKEPVIGEDADTTERGQIASYNAYSADGDVTAPLVYANFGLPEDFRFLQRQGVDVRGKIVIVRYGGAWRGSKVKLAQEAGAVGCILYSDPREDGYFELDPYPRGPARPADGVQRGSVLDMILQPGDPLTPGWASDPNATRIPRDAAKSLPKIPVLPISYADARPLLDQIGGVVAPETWRGALPITYHLGPGLSMVHLKVDSDWTNKPIYNVIATIPGNELKDQWVLYGNHHDAWVAGASDPASGASALLETARTLAQLRSQGWQPRRTIVLALWDAEEFGLIGSTEWVEKHLSDVQQHAAVYINSDSNGRGLLMAAGSKTLESFFEEVLRDVRSTIVTQEARAATALVPNAMRARGDSVNTFSGAGSAGAGGMGSVANAIAMRGSERSPVFRLQPLGAGSDYVAFLHHAGVASLNLQFGREDGSYHSNYDTFDWFRRFNDGEFVYGRALAQIMTTSILRLADSDVLPFGFERLFSALEESVSDVQRLAPKGVPGQATPPPPDLREAANELRHMGLVVREYEDALAAYLSRSQAAPADRLAQLNRTLKNMERSQLLAEGLPGREWYKHALYAPDKVVGYAATTVPTLRELGRESAKDAERTVARFAEVLRAMNQQMEEATQQLKEMAGSVPARSPRSREQR
jgi:N-acetylated-alpha-linked acidic dipeptidase